MNEQEELLARLRDIDLPAASAWPAPGWWLLLLSVLALLVGAVFVVRRLRRNARQRAWQQQVRAELDVLRSGISELPASQWLSRCSILARRMLLVAEPRENVAQLHGDQWLAELDRVCDAPVFSNGFGRLLAEQPYQAQPAAQQQDLLELLDVMESLFVGVKRAGRRKRQDSHAG